MIKSIFKIYSLEITFILTVILIISTGCHKNNDINNSAQLNSASAPPTALSTSLSYEIPHPKNWSNTHVDFYLKSKSKIEGTPQDCFSCHEGRGQAVPLNDSCAGQCHTQQRDSRFSVNHLFSFIDSKLNTLMTDVGTPSASITPTPTAVPAPPLPSPIEPNDCMKCHSNLVPGGTEFIHFPAGAGMCTFCHDVSQKHMDGQDKKGVTTKGADDSCYQCHSKNNDKAHVHPALLMGDPSCVNCHDPHASKHQFFIRQDSVRELCSTCHEPHQGKSVHGAEKIDKNCVNCHNPHSSDQEKMLHMPVEDLCLSCHNKEFPTQFAATPRIIPNIFKKMKEVPYQHMGALMGCLGCHNPHATANERLLNLNYSVLNYNLYDSDPNKTNPYEMCFMCHDKTMLESNTYSTGFRNDKMVGNKKVQKNLHWFHVKDASGYADKSRGRSCRICHDPHGTTQEFHINENWQMNKVKIPIVYKRNDDGGNCTNSCHSNKTYKRLQ